MSGCAARDQANLMVRVAIGKSHAGVFALF